ncbi:MAG: ribosome maturation factor RimM [SAR86 cluster bacterium]|uniref:Ribosome maturation factor RimM n=1 Tax=SAR86 cluster bacterium TaxID=2030880 RepID=A0A2A5CCA2_9GAMM|nr:MAG: ribosome maturation factor RimM [SAR86 cluster bacterium]
MTEQQFADHVLIARVGAAYGIKGWVKLISFSSPKSNILNYSVFLTPQDSSLVELEIDQSKAQGKGFVAHIKGCDDRNLTQEFTGKDLYIKKALLPELGDDEYYWYQLQGMRVKTLSGDDLGVVGHLLETGVNDVLVVKPDALSVDKEERLIPYLLEQVIDSIDPDQRLIKVNWERDY